MNKVLQDLERLGGVHHSCLIDGDAMVASTFPEVLENNLTAAGRVINQMFMAVSAMGCSHKEIFIELEENLLIAYLLADSSILALLTDKDVNLALINTSVRSSIAQLQRRHAEAAAPVISTVAPASKQPKGSFVEQNLSGLMTQLQENLAEFIGPAAIIVFDDAYSDWQANYGVHKSKIAELIKKLAIEIEDKADRSRFLQEAVSIVRASNSSSVRG
jgi:predicted regulator of Ras-like GTPase activity (Roadblock/LC7/MglB family)